MAGVAQNGIITSYARMEGFDSTLLTWVPSPPFSASGGPGGSTQQTVSQLLDSSGGSVTAGDSANQALRVNVVAGAAGGSTAITVSRVQDSSNTGLAVGDSVNNAVRVNVVAGAAGGSTIVTVSALPMVSTAAPAANSSGLNAWIVGGNRLNIGSTAADNAVTISGNSTVVILSGNSSVRANLSSTGADNPVVITAGNSSVRANLSSTGADNPVVITAGNSSVTITTIAAGAGRINIGSTAADNAVLATIGTNLQSTSLPAAGSSGMNVWLVGGNRLNIGSTAADNAVISTPVSTAWVKNAGFTVDSSNFLKVKVGNSTRVNIGSTAADNAVLATIGTNLQSTSRPSSGSSGLIVRQALKTVSAFASTNALASTVLSCVSSVANRAVYVTGYTITTTNQTPAQWGFYSSNGTLLWPMTIAALSSATAGANLAVAAPGFLFKGNANEALNFKTNGSTVTSVQLGVCYFMDA